MKKWIVTFEENGGEYYGALTITANNVEAIGDNNCAIMADHVRIEIDEEIVSIKENKLLSKERG